MAEEKDQERTESATPKRREEARKKGNVAQSREISSVFILFTATGVLLFSASWMFSRLAGLTETLFVQAAGFHLSMENIPAFVLETFGAFAVVVGPLLLFLLLAAVAGNVVQVGFLFSSEALTPNLSKLDPIKGMKNLFSLRSLAELVKSLLKIVLLGTVAFFVLKGKIDRFPGLLQLGVADILSFIGRTSFQLALYSCLALAALAALDYVFQRWRYEEDLKMTKQEVKEERKQQEGDPLIRSRIRRMQTDMARHRMMAAVPEADAVVTNPTHLSVALRYDGEKMAAPQVVAKGAGNIAMRIREIAKENEVPLVEDKPLARALFKSVDIGDVVPFELYQSVAEILAYVYRLKGKTG